MRLIDWNDTSLEGASLGYTFSKLLQRIVFSLWGNTENTRYSKTKTIFGNLRKLDKILLFIIFQKLFFMNNFQDFIKVRLGTWLLHLWDSLLVVEQEVCLCVHLLLSCIHYGIYHVWYVLCCVYFLWNVLIQLNTLSVKFLMDHENYLLLCLKVNGFTSKIHALSTSSFS